MQVVRNESDRELLEALSTLSPADQEVLRLRAYEELTLEQISHVLECSVDAAKQRSSRAIKRLRAQLDKGARVNVDPRATQKGGADGN